MRCVLCRATAHTYSTLASYVITPILFVKRDEKRKLLICHRFILFFYTTTFSSLAQLGTVQHLIFALEILTHGTLANIRYPQQF